MTSRPSKPRSPRVDPRSPALSLNQWSATWAWFAPVKSFVTPYKKKRVSLICDEVMSGFRVAFGGAQSLLGLKPDLTTLGKIVGGGLPVGAYGGRADVMDHILPVGEVFQAGTLSGNPLATAAGCATLKLLKDDPPYEKLETLSAPPNLLKCRTRSPALAA